MKVLMGIVIGIAAVALIAVIVLGYLGFMPGISNLFGSNKPKNLGATYTQSDYQSARTKMGTIISDLPADAAPENSIKFNGQKNVNVTFSQSEFNSLLAERNWKYYPLKDSQLKINPDGTAEFSAVLIKGRIEGFAKALGVSQDNIDETTKYIKMLPGDPAIYIKGKCSVTNNRISQSVSEVKVGKLDLTGQIQTNAGSIVDWVQSDLFTLPGVNIKSFQMVNGSVHFEGTLPDVARSK